MRLCLHHFRVFHILALSSFGHNGGNLGGNAGKCGKLALAGAYVAHWPNFDFFQTLACFTPCCADCQIDAVSPISPRKMARVHKAAAGGRAGRSRLGAPNDIAWCWEKTQLGWQLYCHPSVVDFQPPGITQRDLDTATFSASRSSRAGCRPRRAVWPGDCAERRRGDRCRRP